MAIVAQSRENLTYEEFLRTYDGTFAEWEGGVIVPMSPVTFSHQDLSSFLLTLFRYPLEETGAGQALAAPFQMRLRKVERGREPDIMVVLAENAGRINSTFLDGPADLIVEIVSPESVIRDRETRFAEYEREGVREYWILDPEMSRADFFLLENGRYVRRAPDANGVYRSEVIEGFWIEVSWLWQRPLPTLRRIWNAWEEQAA